MSLFAVTREAGPGWTDGKGAFEQPAMNDHASYMNALAEEGIVVFAGALAGGRVPEPTARDAETVAMRELAKTVREEERLTSALIPVGTGLLVGVLA